MSAPEPGLPNPQKPSRWSVATVLVALLLIIPMLCFGVVLPTGMETVSMILAMAWVVVLIASVLLILAKALQYLVARIRR